LLFFFLVSAEDDDIDQQLHDLQTSKNNIQRYGEKTYDPDYPHIFLLIHDKGGSVSHDVASIKLEKMRKKYAKGFNYVDIWSMNFSPIANTGIDDWEKYLKLNRIQQLDVFEMLDRKQLLNIDEKEICRYFIKELIDQKLMIIVGSKVRNFEHIVKNTKKGVTNMFKNIWKAKDRSENDGLRKDFTMNTQERAMKSLIDISFVFQDYKTFNNYFKYPVSDFKAIKAYKHASS
jgi:hypothetical protein